MFARFRVVFMALVCIACPGALAWAAAPLELVRSEPIHPLLLGKNSDLQLQGLSYGWRGLKADGKRVPFIGAGDIGSVYEHPRVPGAVIKVIRNARSLNMSLIDQAAEEESAALSLSQCEVGPRYLGGGVISRHPASVREKIYGHTLAELIRRREFGAQEFRLVLEMLERMAQGGMSAASMKPDNLMIGSSEFLPLRRAYVVDPGPLNPLPSRLSAPQRREAILNQDIVLWRRYNDPSVGMVPDIQSLREVLEQGLQRSERKPWLEQLKSWIGF